MSRDLAKMNMIAAVQQLPEEDIICVQGYVGMLEDEILDLQIKLLEKKCSDKDIEYKMRKETEKELNKYKSVVNEVIEHIENHKLVYENQYEYESNFDNHLLEMLRSVNNEKSTRS